MSANGWLQFAIFSAVLLASVRPVGIYLARVLEGERTWLDPVLRPIERLIYKLCGIHADKEMNWREYAYSVLGISAVSMVATYGFQRLQHLLPWNPQGLANVGPDLAWNTAASFITNTNWQSYVPETTMSYLTQMAGLAYHNFLSAAMGIAVAVALIRAIKRTSSGTIGNFWVDTTRSLLYVLLPASIIGALLMVAQGVPQNLHAYTTAHTLEGQTQTIAQGPVASQEVIKEMGTNGGGFFNANSAHPFENPTPLINFFEMFLILVIPAGLTYTLGRLTGSPGHGWAVLAAMFFLYAVGFSTVYWAESQPHPMLMHSNVAQTGTATAPAGNMEGKEVRFGITQSSQFSSLTTDASCGAVNTMHDSLTPLGGMMVLINLMFGEVVFGGVGSGMYGILIIVVLSVFIAGLMVLTFTAIFVLSPNIGLSSLGNQGPHGFTEILYAFTSAAANNGSAFAGLNANTWWYNVMLGFTMLAGRFLMIVPVLALAGNLASKKSVPPSPGTFPVNTALFTVLLISVILILSALTFFPALSLGPILEHLSLKAGQLF
jgi:K+-transporting ATPase ATPase A chain